ncbi:aspartate/glutamate racemase family protein [Bacillus sp. PK3-056]|uniref:aspartate/glutamate racemase family protein n=1 Tax=Niallia circulans TaxID=1397 RepID=UPI0013DE5C9B|nr:aspartate/glutamate racemase family protein [Niallia circulans]
MLSNKFCRIGILAGMGPRSTAPFIESVLDECERQYGAKNDIDFPHMIIYSLPTPFHPKEPIIKEDMVKTLQIGIQSLTEANCDFIAVPCNVVHQFYEDMTKMTNVPILNIIQETINAIGVQSSKVGLIGTRSTVENQLYQPYLLNNNKDIYWTERIQSQVDQLIYDVKQNREMEELIQQWKNIELDLTENGVTDVVCVCTDLYFCGSYTSLNFFDSSKILAKSLVERYLAFK